jgi:hypothetical protein
MPPGLRHRPVRLLEEGAIAAISSDGIEWTGEHAPDDLLVHNRLLETLHRVTPLLPLPFGSTANTEEDVTELLRTSAHPLTRAMDAIGGRVEFQLNVHWDQAKAAESVVREDPAVASMKVQMAGKGAAVTLEDRLKIGSRIAQELSARVEKWQSHIVDHLAGASLRHKQLPRGKRDVMLSAAFLVERDRAEAFESAIQELDGVGSQALTLRYAGPFPPYSFVELRLVRADAERLTEARGALELPGEACVEDVHKAFRRRCLETHPDHHPDDPLAAQHFLELHGHYRLVLAYLRSMTDNPATRVPLTPQTARVVLLQEER